MDNSSKENNKKVIRFGQLFVISHEKSCPKNHFATICGDLRRIHELLEADGWFLCATRGDHRQYKHATKKGKVTNIRNYLFRQVYCPFRSALPQNLATKGTQELPKAEGR